MKLDNYKWAAATDEKNFKYKDAISKLKIVKDDYIESLGSDHALVADVLVKLGIVYKKQQKYIESMDAFQEARRIYAELVGYDNFLVAGVSLHLVDVYINTAKFEDASYILSRIRLSIINDKKLMYENEFKTRFARRLFTYHIREANDKFNENPQDLILENSYIKAIRHFSLAKASEFFIGIIKEFYISEDWDSVFDQVKTSLYFFANKEELKISFVDSLTKLINLNQKKFPKNILDSIYNLLHECSNPEINQNEEVRNRKIVERLEKYLDQSSHPEASAINNQARLFKFRERENKMEAEAKKSLIDAHLDVMGEIKASIGKR